MGASEHGWRPWVCVLQALLLSCTAAAFAAGPGRGQRLSPLRATVIDGQLPDVLVKLPSALPHPQQQLQPLLEVLATPHVEAPNGTFIPHGAQNFTLCSPGTFQPRSGQRSCLPCPVGFFCPVAGLSQPIVCPPGRVCDALGTIQPTKDCPHGHFCLAGTKSSKPNASVAIEVPFPCPLGHYCGRGVSSPVPQPKSFDTPQRCVDGFFCPRGSVTPEGRGACPTGYFCPTQMDAAPCPAGHFCPGVGTKAPLQCLPGSFNPHEQRSNCTVCPIGHICPGWGLTLPEECPAGFVCDALGLSLPVQPCPAGYHCPPGTMTRDPAAAIPKKPLPCPAGTFCLGGVAHDIPLDWLPNSPEGATAPQRCIEGTYCGVASFESSGYGLCSIGHYCPPGSSVPIETPRGTFAGREGSVAPTLCYPGTYAPLNATTACRVCPAGYSCQRYGTYIPSVCPPGTYRSLADSVTCRLCPTGTYNPAQGATDITACAPCPMGRVCGQQGLHNLTLSIECPGGYVCGYGTDRSRQFSNACPAGFACAPGSKPEQMFDNICGAGFYCQRGTSVALMTRGKCSVGYYCAEGTASPSPNEMKCPRQSTSLSGQGNMTQCTINPTDVCDKEPFRAEDPFMDNMYYPVFSYTLLDGSGATVRFDSTAEKNPTGEVMVIQKIIPVDLRKSSDTWHNDTIELFRTCPPYTSSTSSHTLQIVGRNFRETAAAVCRYRACLASDIGLYRCKNADGSLGELASTAITVPARYISPTRLECAAPDTDIEELGVGFAEVLVEVSNDGFHFSSENVTVAATVRTSNLYTDHVNLEIPATYAVLTVFDAAQAFNDSIGLEMDAAACNQSRYSEEAERDREVGWFMLPALHQAHVSIDLRHLPDDAVYDEHYKIAIFVRPSRCDYELCNANRIRISPEESLPCKLPKELPDWFLDPSTPKAAVNNFTVYALDDSMIKVEIHITHPAFYALAPFFRNTAVVHTIGPKRAINTAGMNPGQRNLSPYISREQRAVPKEYFFGVVYDRELSDVIDLPLNLPPRYQDYERGRVLLEYNVSALSTSVPDILGPSTALTDAWWDAPTSIADETKEEQDAYFETFHEMSSSQGVYTYALDRLLLPYMPYFSHCRPFGTYIPLWALVESEADCALPDEEEGFSLSWWRRDYPALPDIDATRVVGPFDIGGEPIADWCERAMQCHYQEDLTTPGMMDRWFEGSTGDVLFYLIREPIDYKMYTGRPKAPLLSTDDSGGGSTVAQIELAKGTDVFIPVTINRDAADAISGGCTTQCFPRSVHLDIGYYQLDKQTKRIIYAELIFDAFDFDTSITQYSLQVSYRALNYIELIISFAFETEIFVLLFITIAGASVLIAALYWLVVRLTTHLQSPPALKVLSFLVLVAPPPFAGVILGLIPVTIVTMLSAILIEGDTLMNPDSEPSGWLLDDYALHFTDEALDPRDVERARAGRLGLAFVVICGMCCVTTVKLFILDRNSKRERELERKRDRRAEKEEIWIPLAWKRGNFIMASLFMGFLCICLVEFSLWAEFGTYIFIVMAVLKLVGALLERLFVERQLGESLLKSPVMCAYDFTGWLITLSADDFMDFLLSYCVDFGFLIVERMYLVPNEDKTFKWIWDKTQWAIDKVRRRLPRFLGGYSAKQQQAAGLDPQQQQQQEEGGQQQGQQKKPISLVKKRDLDDLAEPAVGLEPLLDSYGEYSREIMVVLYSPFIIGMLMIFRDEIGIAALYGIKEQDMFYYLLFAIVIIPFQFLTDVFVLNAQELFHGWKIHDYLVYTRYRFLQRETRWKGLEDTMDECIAEDERAIDHLCFSSQYYMILLLHTNAIAFFVLGVVMMIHNEYNMFGDPAAFVVAPFVICCSIATEKTLMYAGSVLKIWRSKHENTEWHTTMQEEDDIDIPAWEDVKGASHDAYLMNQRITSETFRYKFMNYNRAWLVQQLPSILTPRTLRRSRPYLINQLQRILSTKRGDISSDSDEDMQERFGAVALAAPSRAIIRWWLEKARLRLRLREIIQPLVIKARAAQCQTCLSRKQLQVDYLISIEDMYEQYLEENPEQKDAELDQIAWKTFWMKRQVYKTTCLPCIAKQKELERTQRVQGVYDSDSDGDDDDSARGVTPDWGPVFLSPASRAIMLNWYRRAQATVNARRGRRARANNNQPVLDISDDEVEEYVSPFGNTPVHLSPASKAIAVKWLRAARANLQSATAGKAKKNKKKTKQQRKR